MLEQTVLIRTIQINRLETDKAIYFVIYVSIDNVNVNMI